MKVFAIGSCRIHRPLRKMEDLGRLQLLNRVDPQWFCHTARGAIQFFRMAVGGDIPPPKIQNLIFETHPMGRKISFCGSKQVEDCDVILVEISSLKSNDYLGWELNQHLLNKSTDIDVSDTETWRASVDEMVDYLGEILRLSGKPVLLVDHIFCDEHGTAIEYRKVLTSHLEDVALRLGVDLIKTESFLHQVNISAALEDQNHYLPEFEQHVGERRSTGSKPF